MAWVNPAPLPGETPMLAAVVASPADDAFRLIYADWLEERGDPRGAYLREFVDALRTGGELPPGERDIIPFDWREMAGLNLLRGVREAGVAEHRDLVMALVRPALAIVLEPSEDDRIPIGATKFGGRPDLPAGAEWPRCDRGPLEFLAQLGLAEFRRTLAGQALPPSGLLSFFMFHDRYQDEYGNGREWPPEHSGGLRVLHTPDVASLRRLDPPDDLDEVHGRPNTPAVVGYSEVLDVPEPGGGVVTWALRSRSRASRGGGRRQHPPPGVGAVGVAPTVRVRTHESGRRRSHPRPGLATTHPL